MCFVLALPGPLWWAACSIAGGVPFAATMLLAVRTLHS
ncbi:hypothetical protein STVIR_4516 [Streptomyces viridochromogenes Tue57]|uniref:Uncharacterized protein n=1 Tax=Streptomyces viridochromogenes Tue57 TaxID=1160705 RepID=L8PGD5_STRVR|nr:hypothetical protein STVIR_4516 [Streptomyces viridochromogenes Tue57]